MHAEFSDTDTLTCTVDPSASTDLSRHDAVKLTGDRQVAATDTQDEAVFGIAQGDPSPGPAGRDDIVTVSLGGVKNANVADEYDDDNDGATADVAVEAPAFLTPSGNPGELKPIHTGEDPQDGPELRLLAAPDGDGMGQVLVR